MVTRTRDKDGRLRYHGAGKRGRNDLRTAEIDLTHAIQSLELAVSMVKAARATQDRVERAARVGEARERADLGARFTRAALRGGLVRRKAETKPKSPQMRLPLGKRKEKP